jgi:hypothetical protein
LSNKKKECWMSGWRFLGQRTAQLARPNSWVRITYSTPKEEEEGFSTYMCAYISTKSDPLRLAEGEANCRVAEF